MVSNNTKIGSPFSRLQAGASPSSHQTPTLPLPPTEDTLALSSKSSSTETEKKPVFITGIAQREKRIPIGQEFPSLASLLTSYLDKYPPEDQVGSAQHGYQMNILKQYPDDEAQLAEIAKDLSISYSHEKPSIEPQRATDVSPWRYLGSYSERSSYQSGPSTGVSSGSSSGTSRHGEQTTEKKPTNSKYLAELLPNSYYYQSDSEASGNGEQTTEKPLTTTKDESFDEYLESLRKKWAKKSC